MGTKGLWESRPQVDILKVCLHKFNTLLTLSEHAVVGEGELKIIIEGLLEQCLGKDEKIIEGRDNMSSIIIYLSE